MSAENSTSSSLPSHSRTLGICWIIYGVIRLVVSLWLIVFNGTATVMFGALLNRVPDPFTMMSEFHTFYIAVIVWSILCGVLGIVGGLATVSRQRSARSILVLAAFLSLSDLPVGITLGVYTLILLLPRSGQASDRA